MMLTGVILDNDEALLMGLLPMNESSTSPMIKMISFFKKEEKTLKITVFFLPE